MTHTQIDAGLAERAEEFTRALFADHAIEQDGARLSLSMQTGERIAVDIGFKAGTWTMNGEEGRGLSLLWATARGVIHKHALRECAQWLGGEIDEPAPAEPAPVKAANGAKAHSQQAPQRTVDRQQRVTYLPDIQRLLPQAGDAERGVLSSFLLAPLEIGRLCHEKGITEAHFHLPANAIIYGQVYWLWEQRMPIDFITLTQMLRDQKLLDECGGAGYVTELFTFLPTAANAGYYIEILEEKHTLREMIKVCTEYASRSHDEQDDVPRLLEEVEGKITKLAEWRKTGNRIRLPTLESVTLWTREEDLPPEPPQVIKGVLHQGSKLIIGGTSKGRKTFALLDLAASVAAGAPWWGTPTNKGRVCYLNFELQRFAIAKRIRWIHEAKAIAMSDNFQMMTLRGWTDPIENLAEKLIEYFRALPPFSLIVFDPVYKLLGDRDENKVGDVTQLLNHIEKIGVETGAATAFGHHYSKGNQAAKESIDRMGGSGAFARDPDAILTMTAHETEDCFVIEPTLRNFAPVPKYVIRWDAPLFKPATDLNPEDLKQPKGAKPTKADGLRKNAALKNATAKLGRYFAHGCQAYRAMIAAASRIPSTSFDRWWAELKEAGYIVPVGPQGNRKGLWQASQQWAKDLEDEFPPQQPDLDGQ